MAYHLHIHDRTLAVSDDRIGEVESDILDAVRMGGAFVTIGDGDHTRFLVTPATFVWVERLTRAIVVPEVDPIGFDMSYLDVDL